jgi:hypothetical protein
MYVSASARDSYRYWDRHDVAEEEVEEPGEETCDGCWLTGISVVNRLISSRLGDLIELATTQY